MNRRRIAVASAGRWLPVGRGTMSNQFWLQSAQDGVVFDIKEPVASGSESSPHLHS
jgi:hypothetical protein